MQKIVTCECKTFWQTALVSFCFTACQTVSFLAGVTNRMELLLILTKTPLDFRILPRCRWDLRSSGILLSVECRSRNVGTELPLYPA